MIIRVAAILAVLAAALLVAPTSASAASTCVKSVSAGQAFTYVCEYSYTRVIWPDQHQQYFYVEPSGYSVRTVYERRPYTNDWVAMGLGGEARSKVIVYNLTWTSITIEVRGTDGRGWCKPWTSATGWQSWRTVGCGEETTG